MFSKQKFQKLYVKRIRENYQYDTCTTFNIFHREFSSTHTKIYETK
jgi:hypothetical protein